jgi:hypothetical protein
MPERSEAFEITKEAWGDRPLPIQERREAVYRNGLAGGLDAKKGQYGRRTNGKKSGS